MLSTSANGVALELAQTAEEVRTDSTAAAILTALLFLAALAVGIDRRRTIIHAGIGIAVVGALLVIAYQVSRSLVLDGIDDADARAAAGGAWDGLAEGLRSWSLACAGIGVVVAAAAASLIRPADVESRSGAPCVPS